jgi:Ca2+-binding RTX toxin-like protein
MAFIPGTNGNDYDIKGTNASDLIRALAGHDRVVANAGNDVVHGGHGNDFISAGAGADNIYGDTGDDYLRGDAGADSFRFTVSNGNDTVADFRPWEGDTWTLYGVTPRYVDLGSSTLVLLNGYDDTIEFLYTEPDALRASLTIQSVSAYDWINV